MSTGEQGNNPNLYAVHIKTSKGSRVDALFTKDGKLVRSKEVIKNSELPKSILNTIEKSDYKGCKITDDKAVIKNNDNNSIHYSVMVEKNNKKHWLYFDKDGKQLKNHS